MSNIDIFGDSLNLMANDIRWFFGLFNWDPDYKPYNAFFTELLTEEAKFGGTLKEVFQRLKRKIKTGVFMLDYMFGQDWNVYRTAQHMQGVDGSWGGSFWVNFGVSPEDLEPKMPYQTYVEYRNLGR